MSGEYVIPEAPWTVNVNVLPTERLHEIVQTYHRMAEALIELATNFGPAVEVMWDGQEKTVGSACYHCGENVEDGCWDGCPGLLARRALGVA